MPKFGFKGTKISGPDVDVNVKLPDAKVDEPKISSPGVEMNVEMPEVEGDINLSLKKKRGKSKEKDGKSWEFHMPKFGFNGPKIHGPDVDGKINGLEIDVEKPQVDVKMPEIKAEVNLKKPKISGSDFDVNVEMPQVDLKMPEFKGDVDVSLKNKKPDKNGKEWDFKMPKFGFKAPKIS
ncbi:hypothetical protein BLA29_012241, partial [Euroglyphus maynei]